MKRVRTAAGFICLGIAGTFDGVGHWLLGSEWR